LKRPLRFPSLKGLESSKAGSINTGLPILSFGQTWESLDFSEPLKYRP